MKMKKNWKRFTAGICAVVMCFGTMGILPANALEVSSMESVQAKAGELKTRNVHIQMDGVNTWESEHFKFYWGNSGDSGQVTESFLQENAKNLEACWNVYMNDLSMNPPTQSVNEFFRDGNEYKVNFYIHNTGLKGENGAEIPTDWAYMGYDREGYAFMFCCVGAMNNSPNPSWVLPHEFGHVVTAHQYGWNENKYVQSWWEAIANWYREQFLYSDYYQQWANITGTTDYFETYMKNLCFTPILGRDNYASWVFLQYLTDNPDNLGNYGKDFMKTLMQQGQRDEYPYKEIERLGNADMKETLGKYAARLATLDFNQQDAYQKRQSELLNAGEWNWNEIYTVLEKTTSKDNYYTVPTERAPQQFGINIIPLNVTGDSISVTLEGLTDVKGADWRACIVYKGAMGGAKRYSDLFKSGETMTLLGTEDTEYAYLVVTATPDSDTWQEIGVPWVYGEGEFDENHYPFLSKTRYPYGVTIEGAEVQQTQYRYTQGHTHANGGGFVASTANVDDSVYVGKNAKVLGHATVTGNAKIDGYAIVTGSAKVSDNAVVTGHAVVAERATVKDSAIVGDNAGVMGNAVVSGHGRVIESGLVFNDYQVSGDATVKGVSYGLAKGAVNGQAITDGDYYDDSSRTITSGAVYGWASPDSYVNSRPYNDGQTAGLEFDSDSSHIANDTFTSTYGVSVGSPAWDEVKTSGKGVLTFNSNQYLVADSSYAELHDVDYQTAVLIREDGDIFRFGSNEKYLTLTTDNGALYLIANDGTKSERLEVKNAYEKGKWAVISVAIIEDKVKVNVNGETKATGEMTIDPIDIVSEDATYILGGGGLSMDYFRANFKEVAEPEYYYTETEDVTIEPEPMYRYGDMTCDNVINVVDLALLKQMVLFGDNLPKHADCDGDGKAGVGDIIALQRYLHKLDNTGRTGTLPKHE